MKLSYLAVSALFASIVYLSASLFVSVYSQEAYEALSDHARRLEVNVRELRDLNGKLVARADLYRRSSDAVAVEARRLQYFEPDQEIIRLRETPGRVTVQSPGTILRRTARRDDHRAYVRAASIISFVLAFTLQCAVDLKSGRSFDRPIQEIRRASR